jgi:hypothetical protein
VPAPRFSRPVLAAFAQPGQLAPVQPSISMQDSNLKPALPGSARRGRNRSEARYQVPLNLQFIDEAGATVPLSSFFHSRKPVILALVYYRCPMLCTQILNGLESSSQGRILQPRPGFRNCRRQLRPEGHLGTGRRQETDLSEALRPRQHRQRLAFPHRRRGQHQSAHRCGGLPLQIRPGHRSVRARQRHHDPHSRRPPLALFLRRGIRPARRAPRPGGSVAEQDRQPRRSDSAVLLPLRSPPPANMERW